MAESKGNIVMHNTSGAIGKEIVFKILNGKTINGKFPDRSGVIYTDDQLHYRLVFCDAVKFATEIYHDPVKSAAYPVKEDRSVYYCAISDYMYLHSQKHLRLEAIKTAEKYLENHTLNARQVKAVKCIFKKGSITNAAYQKLNTVSKATATRDLQQMVKNNVLQSSGIKGAGAKYKLIFLWK